MIRRAEGSRWLLISQVDHAALAAEIAAAWREPALPPGLEELFLQAVRHHDAGWASWEAAPRIDPGTGIPRNFTEMPMFDAEIIWTDSIHRCAAIDAWAGMWVSRHFTWLAERARESRRDVRDQDAIERFLCAQAELQSAWMASLSSQVRDAMELEILCETGFRRLQFFDALSLWLCCATRTEPHILEAGNQPSLGLRPETSERIGLEPYPLKVPELALETPARSIEAQRLESDGALQWTLQSAETATLRWTLGM